MRMDVLNVFPNDFPSFSRWEGSRTRLLEICSGLSKLGLHVALACVQDPAYDPTNAFEGIHLSYLSRALPLNAHYALFPLLYRLRAAALLKRLKPKIIHYHMAPAALAGLAAPFPNATSVFDLHDIFFIKDEFYKRSIRVPKPAAIALDAFEMALLDNFDAVFVTGPLMEKLVEHCTSTPTYIVPNAVDAQFFTPSGSKMKQQIFGPGKFVIGHLGATRGFLGVQDLIRALSLLQMEIPELRALIVGKTNRGLIELAKQEGVSSRVLFTDYVPHEKLPSLIRSMDIGVSLRQRTSQSLELADFYQPTKVLEYMACGVPVLVTPLAAQADMIQKADSGVVAHGFTAEYVADAIRSMCMHRDSLTTLGLNGRAYVVNNHSISTVVSQVAAAYCEVEPSLPVSPTLES